MKRGLIVLLTAATMGAAALPAPALAGSNGGAVAAGVIGGLAAGALIGSAASQPRYAPAPAYAPAPVYVEPARECYYTRGRPVWDEYRGAYVRPRVQVCD